jgi:hemolysin activation/secretion protein
VQLPEQDIADGIVRLKVIEARLGRIRVEGSRHFSDENIRASVPALVEGGPPNIDRAGASLALANDSFAKRTRVTLQRGETSGSVDAVLRVADIHPWRIATSLDNTGNSATGDYRFGVTYQHANLFDRDHAFSAQYVTSPDHLDKVSILGLGYKIPIYARGDSIEAAYGRSNVDSGNVSTAAGNYGISGRGEFATLRYNLGLPRFAGIEQRLSIAQDWRLYESKIVSAGDGPSLIPTLSSAPTSLTYTLSSPVIEQASQWKVAVGYVNNQLGGPNGSTADYNQAGARPGADARFQLWRWNISLLAPLPGGFTLRADMNGQETRDLLISGEQFGIGGMDSVRGYGEREILNDRGYRGTLELSTAPFDRSLGDTALRTTFVAFHDFGAVYRNEPLPGELHDEHAASVGLGMRLAAGQNTYLRADIARALRSAGATQDGDVMAHVQMMVMF